MLVRKNLTRAIPPRKKMAHCAIEVGYSEPYEKLLEDATLLLEGSEGKIGLVILISSLR